VGGQSVPVSLAGDHCVDQHKTVADDLRNIMQSSSKSSPRIISALPRQTVPHREQAKRD
jgi:hypothetical protein